jgi:hypothetical protein
VIKADIFFILLFQGITKSIHYRKMKKLQENHTHKTFVIDTFSVRTWLGFQASNLEAFGQQRMHLLTEPSV